ncbi:AN1-type zinc finger protein 4-like [Tubulanus polymorphus]|uniref:AN1-type zinc finger protein 4-like n=1 Tax=Tubulanus polymorphus TaxID=672921 RepID=UPI003DA331E7
MPIMELFIETLTGTAFELRVSPFETIMSVKAKIQRLEGIPISQQHLIWQSTELEDDYCLHDYSIHDGATLKLVLQMRGGPINTRRIAVDDPALREMAEYMEANRDEIFEKLPSGNRQVTLLVFREGDQLNFFRVVDRGDGTLTPLSESFSGTSVYNLYDEDDDDECPTKEKLEENDKLKEKMISLRSKMETLTIQKKPKKKVRPVSGSRPSSRGRLRHIPSATALNMQQPLNPNPCLPPVGSVLSGLGGGGGAGGAVDDTLSVLPAKYSSPSTPVDKLADVDQSPDDPSEHAGVMLPKIIGSSSEIPSKYGLYSVNEDRTVSPSTSAHRTLLRAKNTTEEIARNKRLLRRPASTNEAPPAGDTTQSADRRVKELKNSTFPPPPSASSSSSSSRRGKDLTLESIKESLRTARERNKRGADLNLESIREALGRRGAGGSTAASAASDNVDSTTSAKQKKEFTIESLSTTEARAMSGLLRQASIERLGSSRISGNFVASANKSRYAATGNRGNTASTLKDGTRIVTPDARLMSAHLQRLSASRDGRLPSPTRRLPPVKTKKKSHKRCFLCGKKTGLATSYQCRCDNNFCANHRYAEAHDCTFDYKTEGRKLLEQANPVVSAPKLPKI